MSAVEKIEIKLDAVTIGLRKTSVAQTTCFEAVHEDFSFPIGHVYVRPILNSALEVLDSYVKPSFRRNGIRTKIQEMLVHCYPWAKYIVSQHGTEDGLAWMKSMGYQQMPNGDWIYEIKRK